MITTTGNWEAEQLEAKLSRRVGGLRGSFWVQPARDPNAVPPILLTGGIPDPASLPVEGLIEASNRVLRDEGDEALRYGGPQGLPALREWIAADFGHREGLDLTEENVTLTNGSAGALANVCETFLDEGDVALIEAPTFPVGVRVMHACLAGVESVAVDEQGLMPEKLEEAIERLEREGRRPKLLYTIVNFHNPTGATMTLERRRAVVDICRLHQVLIMEDDAYGAIRIDGEAIPSLLALAGCEGAVYVGTFSKTIATGLRVGYAIGAKPVIDAMLRMRFDMGASPWLHRTIYRFAESGALDQHVGRVIEIYRRKRDALLAGLDERCARYARWQAPDGGFFLWLQLDPSVSSSALLAAAERHGVQYARGENFFFEGSGGACIRLAFSYVREDEMAEAALRLGRALEEAASGQPA